ncbi:hypothetical protein BH23VER1_BH23VER1_08150 [soil metagenome]
MRVTVVVIGSLLLAWFWFGRSPQPQKPTDARTPLATPLAVGSPPEIRATDPRLDGWDSEVFAEEALAQLAALADRLSADLRATALEVTGFTAKDFRCSPLRPTVLREVFRDGSLVARRWDPKTHPAAAIEPMPFAEALDPLLRPELEPEHLSLHFKMVSVELDPAGEVARGKVICEVAGNHARGRFEAHAEWGCEWHRRDGLPPLLSKIEPRDYQEAELVANAGASQWFTDTTGAVLGGNPSFHQQLAFGTQHWLGRVERVHLMLFFQRSGLAIGDANGDGLDDLYLCQPGGLPNRLFVQQADGTAVDVSREAGVDWLDHTASALFLDLDNDGDQDLVLATTDGLQLLANDGSGRYERKLSLPTADSDPQSLVASDYDNDGDLDLYLCMDYSRGSARPGERRPGFVYDDANDGGANILFQNNISAAKPADWLFENVTVAVGLDQNNRRHSLAAAWEDYDGDGDQDLYVANDYGLNSLYRNDAGTGRGERSFTDVAKASGVLDPGSGMSADWGDYNGDGRMDLYVGNMFSSAGNRITRQELFQPGGKPGLRPILQRFAKGSSLFSNSGDGSFRETGAMAGVELGRWAWSSLFCDLNNDGWEDLFVANGYLSTEDSGDL